MYCSVDLVTMAVVFADGSYLNWAEFGEQADLTGSYCGFYGSQTDRWWEERQIELFRSLDK